MTRNPSERSWHAIHRYVSAVVRSRYGEGASARCRRQTADLKIPREPIRCRRSQNDAEHLVPKNRNQSIWI